MKRLGSVVGIMGQMGWGKTTVMRAILEQTAQMHPNYRFCIWDSGQADEQFVNDLNPDNMIVFEKKEDIPLLQAILLNTKEQFLVWCGDFDFTEDFLKPCIEAGGVNIVIDEIDEEMTKTGLTPELTRIINRGRHVRGRIAPSTSLLWNTRRSQKVHNDLLSATRTLYLLATMPHDFQKIERDWGMDPLITSEDLRLAEPLEVIRLERGGKLYLGETPFVLDMLTPFAPYPEHEGMNEPDESEEIPTESPEPTPEPTSAPTN